MRDNERQRRAGHDGYKASAPRMPKDMWRTTTNVRRIVLCNHIRYTVSGGDQELSAQGLGALFTTGIKSGIQAKHERRLRLILGTLNAATASRDMGLPGLDLHELRGARKGTWAVKVSGNWWVTFRFAGKDAEQVDYEDYH